jgi:hypothetical protein
VETINQNSPQADALIAPELLTVMAGGQGSGMRMNEAEIARIIGGRSKWESLKSSINQWSADPTKANSILPEQRNQIRSLIDAVNKKYQDRLDVVGDARYKLINATDPEEHKKIYGDLKKKLSSVGGAKDESSPAQGKRTIKLADGTEIIEE